MAKTPSIPAKQMEHPLMYALARNVRTAKDQEAKSRREAARSQGDLVNLLMDVLPEDGLGVVEVVDPGYYNIAYKLTRSKSTRRAFSVDRLLELGVDPGLIEQAYVETESYSLRITEHS